MTVFSKKSMDEFKNQARLKEAGPAMLAALEAIVRMAKRGSEATDMTRNAYREGLTDIQAVAQTAINSIHN